MKDKLVLNRVRNETGLPFFLFKIPVNFRNPPPFRRLSVKPHQSKLLWVSASQLFGRSVAHFFHPLRSTGKNMKDKLVLNMVRDEPGLQFFLFKTLN
ncbi:hypothetical protein ACQKKK_00365 [Peribacillus sp. NPDC006672]|uniref:hypothetical protein n=1 Tax=Peribacillus sp. NPDC006672 TaxID=3390606 RepID=UPI003D02BC3F